MTGGPQYVPRMGQVIGISSARWRDGSTLFRGRLSNEEKNINYKRRIPRCLSRQSTVTGGLIGRHKCTCVFYYVELRERRIQRDGFNWFYL